MLSSHANTTTSTVPAAPLPCRNRFDPRTCAHNQAAEHAAWSSALSHKQSTVTANSDPKTVSSMKRAATVGCPPKHHLESSPGTLTGTDNCTTVAVSTTETACTNSTTSLHQGRYQTGVNATGCTTTFDGARQPAATATRPPNNVLPVCGLISISRYLEIAPRSWCQQACM